MSARPSTAINDDPAKKQRLQRLRELEEQKRRQKNAKLGMLVSSSNPTSPVSNISNESQSNAGVSSSAKSSATSPVKRRPESAVPVSIVNISDIPKSAPLVVSVASAPSPADIHSPTHLSPKAVTSITVKPIRQQSRESLDGESMQSTDVTVMSHQNSNASVQPQVDISSNNMRTFEIEPAPVSPTFPIDNVQSEVPAASALPEVFDPTVDRTATTSSPEDAAVMPASVPIASILVVDPHSFSPEDLADLRTFVGKVVPQGKRMQCRITRRTEGVEKLFPQYDFYLEQDADHIFLMTSRKRKKSRYANYAISTSKTSTKSKSDNAGKVRSNFFGTEFNVYDHGFNPTKAPKDGQSTEARRELAVVAYDPNLLGFKGPRKMTVLIPRITKSGPPVNIQPNNPVHAKGKFRVHDSALERYRRNDFRDILVLQNKSPQWNEDTQSYVLNFNGRVTMASVKNFQIVHESDLDYIVMQFGRVGEESFTVDLQYPLSPLQAFSIALTSFDAKLACE